MQEIQQAADFLEIPYLSKSIAASIQQPTNQNESIRNYATVSETWSDWSWNNVFIQCFDVFQFVKKSLEKCINRSTFSDVTFELDDGQMKSHRAMLIARCDMMRAMLNGDFREAHSNVVSIRILIYIRIFFGSNSVFYWTFFTVCRSFSPASPNTRSINYFAISTPTRYLKFQRKNV